LFDILNQARAYNYLKDIGCSRIRFISRINGSQTPDLEATLESSRVLCEVKTINISQEEVYAREKPKVRSRAIQLGDGFFKKLQSDIDKAKNQFDAYDQGSGARRIVYINPCFDDFLGEMKVAYFQQIDEYFLENPVQGIELVFHNDRTPFHKDLHMKTATVVN